MNRKKAWLLYAILLIVSITTNLILPGIGNLIWSALLSIITAITIVYFLCTNPSKTKSIATLIPEPKEQKNPTLTTTEPNDAKSHISINAPTQIIRPPRLHYLDNLKSILTIIVVVHHITMAFSANGGWYYVIGNYYNVFQIPSSAIQLLDQSYFMCLFFFISGYFTPISCKRKGIKLFLCDKFKRLGIPFIIYELVLGPLIAFFINYLVIKHNDYSYGADAGPCWFLLWLLIFNVCYIIIDQNIPFLQVKFPSIWYLILYGGLFGLIQFAVVIVIPEGSFIFMPIVPGSLPFDILFFTSGILAKYNGWLDIIHNLSKYNVIVIRTLTIICSLIIFILFSYLYIIDFGYNILPKKNKSDHDCDDDDNWTIWYSNIIYCSLFILFGICCIIISLTMIQFSYSYLNFSNKYTKFFSKSAYTVYIMHPLVVVPVTYSFQVLLNVWNGQQIFFCHNKSVSQTHFDNNLFIWFGWIYTIVLSLIILWPTSFYIRQIPGLNKIL